MSEEIFLIKITYPSDKIENLPGIIDHSHKIIRVFELNNEEGNFIERGFINMDYVKRVDILKKLRTEN